MFSWVKTYGGSVINQLTDRGEFQEEYCDDEGDQRYEKHHEQDVYGHIGNHDDDGGQ